MRARTTLAALLLLPLLAGPLAAQTMAVRLPAGGCAWQVVPGVAWGAAVRSFSSQYNTSGWAATQVLGAPNVFPQYGDLVGAWAPSSTSNPADYIEVLFPGPVMAAELWVFETNGAGGTYAVATLNADGSMTPAYAAGPTRLGPAAAQLVVPLGQPRPILGVRIDNASAAVGTYAELDAVGASPVPACSTPGAAPLAVGMGFGGATRLSLSEYAGSMPTGGVVWAMGVVSFSSQYSTDTWAAYQALGAPNVFPRWGDLAGTWAPASTSSREESLILQFPPTVTQQILVFETYGVGGLYQVLDVSGGSTVLLWAGPPGPAIEEARVLRITLPQPRQISVLRLVTSPAAVGEYPEIDAVGLVPAR